MPPTHSHRRPRCEVDRRRDVDLAHGPGPPAYRVIARDAYTRPAMNARKAAIVRGGPAVVGMNVAPDFVNYQEGFYSATTESIACFHEVLVIGGGGVDTFSGVIPPRRRTMSVPVAPKTVDGHSITVINGGGLGSPNSGPSAVALHTDAVTPGRGRSPSSNGSTPASSRSRR